MACRFSSATGSSIKASLRRRYLFDLSAGNHLSARRYGTRLAALPGPAPLPRAGSGNSWASSASFSVPVFISLFSTARIASGYASAARPFLESLTGHRALRLISTTRWWYSRRELLPIRGKIAFEDVSFGYNPDEPVLEGISFCVEPGQTVAIVGQTGCGKSTLSKLVNRIYDVDRGRVLVDGVDARDWNLQALRSQISIIEQDIFLFSRSVAENIAFGRDEVDRDSIIESAKAAQAHEFISAFPAGYDTVIGQRGMTLSGGQRQRLRWRALSRPIRRY